MYNEVDFMLAPSEQNAFRFKRIIKVPLPPDIFVLYISNLKKHSFKLFGKQLYR